MLGERIVDGIESGEGEASGLGLLPVETVFEEEKLLARPAGRAPLFGDAEVSGYEIRHGRVYRRGGDPLFVGEGLDEGCRAGAVFGTSWHGVMESDAFRRRFLRRVADQRGLDWAPGEESFAEARENRLDRLGDLVSENVDREALLRLIDEGQPSGLPFVRLQVSGNRHQESGEPPVGPARASGSNGQVSILDPVVPAAPAVEANGPENLKPDA
jgi:adenosylcobyric acid synthase